MPKLFTINNVGQAGLNSDQPAWGLPPEFISDGANFRVRDSKVMPFGGSKLVFQSPEGPVVAGICAHIRIRIGDFWVQCTQDAILASATSDPSIWIQLNKDDFNLVNGEEKQWTICQLGQVIVFNHPEVGPWYLQGAVEEGALLPLPYDATRTWQDIGLRCSVMRAHKTFLIAMNLLGTETSPNGYRISTSADTDSYPFTWDIADRGGIAIRAQLGSDGGEILDGKSLRDEFCLYSRNSIDLLNFQANSPFYWQRRELSSTIGLLHTNCVAEVKGVHYLIVDGDIVRNDGTNIQSIIDGRLLRRFNARINKDTRLNSFVVRNDFEKEIWFCVPEEEAEDPSAAYVYNWANDTLYLRDLPAQTRFADYGVDPTTEAPEAAESWVGIPDEVLWDHGGDDDIWGGIQSSALNERLLVLTKNGQLKNVDPKNKIDEEELGMIVERISYPLDGHRQTNTITRVYPHASGAAFIIQIGAQQFASGPVVWSTERTFTPEMQRKIDIRITGEAFAWRVKSIDANRFVFSGMDVEYTPAGIR